MDDRALTAIGIMTRIDQILGGRLLASLDEDARTDEVIAQRIALLALQRLASSELPIDLEAECQRRADILVERLEAQQLSAPMAAA